MKQHPKACGTRDAAAAAAAGAALMYYNDASASRLCIDNQYVYEGSFLESRS